MRAKPATLQGTPGAGKSCDRQKGSILFTKSNPNEEESPEMETHERLKTALLQEAEAEIEHSACLARKGQTNAWTRRTGRLARNPDRHGDHIHKEQARERDHPVHDAGNPHTSAGPLDAIERWQQGEHGLA